jgi:hypothetical protein
MKAWTRRVESAEAALGQTPEARVQWLIDFATRDLAALSAREWVRTWRALFRLLGGFGLGRGFAADEPGWGAPLTKTQRLSTEMIQLAVRGLLEDLAHGRPHGCDVAVRYFGFSPPPRRPTGQRVSGRIERTLPWGREVDSVSAAVLRTVELLDEIGADRLRACECGRLFLAVRRQRHCSREHANRAAWRAHMAREGVAEARKLAR